MKKPNYLSAISLFMLVLVISCSQSQKEEIKEVKIQLTEKISEDGSAKNVAMIGIEGMSCAVGCAGKIQKTLAGIDGVLSCDVDFDNKKANVQFNDEKISEKELIAAIEALNDKQYKVTTVEIEKTILKEKNDSAVETDEEEKESQEKKTATISTKKLIKFPTIFSALTRIYAY